MKIIYLIRHGLIDYTTQQLAPEGVAFAKILPERIPKKLNFICSDESKRCLETVKILADHSGLDIHKFSKIEFSLCQPLSQCMLYNRSAICYRIETINPILEKIGLSVFMDETRDSAYEFIWKVKLDDKGNILNDQKIPTGYSKFNK